jgi:uncharacterized membrane protein
MAEVQTSIDIHAPVDHVWQLVTDLERLGEWVSIHREFPSAPPAEVAQGTTFAQTLAVAGTPFTVNWTAAEVDGPGHLTWEGTGPAGATARTTYALTAENGGTRFSYANEFRMPGGRIGEAATEVVAGQAEREANESLARLKQLAEA